MPSPTPENVMVAKLVEVGTTLPEIETVPVDPLLALLVSCHISIDG